MLSSIPPTIHRNLVKRTVAAVLAALDKDAIESLKRLWRFWKQVRCLHSPRKSPGTYEVLDYASCLELIDAKGKKVK
jgi:hypothetical protein